MSKISGYNFRQGGSSQIITRTTDFDDSIEMVKSNVHKTADLIKTLNLNSHEKIVYKFDKILKLSPRLKFSEFIKLKEKYDAFANKIEQARIQHEEDEKNKRLKLFNPETDFFTNSYRYNSQLNMLGIDLNRYISNFSNTEIEKIDLFFSDYINNDKDKLINLIDAIGCENLNQLCLEINNLENLFLKGKIDLESIKKIKLLVLKEKGLVSSVI